jgi:phosphoribosylformylglycinamidine cyclo-ligase
MATTYKDSGVDVEKGDEFVRRITEKVKSTYNARVVSGIGGFAALYDMGDRYLSSATDGVGTKIKIAQKLGIHNTVGIDLVAMCVNDLICNGSRPLFFLDYLASGSLDIEVNEALVTGIVEGCKQSSCALIGGETAEMPGVYNPGEYDLAGFAVGEVDKDKLIDGKAVKPGMDLVALPSSGLHSNGFSLVRKLIEPHETELLKEALTPTQIYVQHVTRVMREVPGAVKGIAHITGGGLHNIARINEEFGYKITTPASEDNMLPVLREVIWRSKLEKEELYKTFNMGVGLVLVTDQAEKVMAELENEAWILGEVVKSPGLELSF